jgi:hypothetical protein
MASSKDFVPAKEADLVPFLQNFGTRAAAEAAAIGLLPAQCTAFNADVTAFVAAWDITRDRSTRSGSAVIVKNEKKALVVKSLRTLAGVVQKHPGTTNEQRDLLGLTVPAVRQRRPVPTTIPVVEQKGTVNGNTVTIRFHDTGSTRRGLPNDVASAQVFTYVGASVPTDPKDWFFMGVTTRTTVEVPFDADLPMGTKAWICVAWANERGQPGQSSPAFGVTLLGSTASPTGVQSESNVKLAA